MRSSTDRVFTRILFAVSPIGEQLYSAQARHDVGVAHHRPISNGSVQLAHHFPLEGVDVFDVELVDYH